MIIFAVILLIVAGCCFFAARGQAARLRAIDATDTFTAQMLQELYKRVVSELGGEALAKQCEVEGVIEAEAPLIARNPHDEAQKFIISRRGERELANATASAARNWYYASIGSGALGLVLLTLGLVQ